MAWFSGLLVLTVVGVCLGQLSGSNETDVCEFLPDPRIPLGLPEGVCQHDQP